MSPMFAMTDVTVCYDHVEAVRNVSLSVEEGQIVTVIGPNGAGKTTLLMAAIGLLASRGRIRFQGSEIGRMIRQKMPKAEQPSIRAASRMSFGISLK